jgi:electron transfer flavoprotein beta subunit
MTATPEGTQPQLAVCLKWVDRRAEVDPLTGIVHTDARSSGASDADQAALELGLQLAEAWGAGLTAVTAAGAVAEPMLRDALAAGASRAVRVDVTGEATSAEVAAGLAPVLTGADVVLCGAWSHDRGSGSVPAYLSAHRGAAQALGLVALIPTAPGRLEVERRLDGGRRERLALVAPAVVSVEAGVARLRRASLEGVRTAPQRPIEVVGAPPRPHPPVGPRVGPYRPRPQVLAGPAGTDARQRVLALTGVTIERSAARVVSAGPAEGADAIVDQLRAWGYLE